MQKLFYISLINIIGIYEIVVWNDWLSTDSLNRKFYGVGVL